MQWRRAMHAIEADRRLTSGLLAMVALGALLLFSARTAQSAGCSFQRTYPGDDAATPTLAAWLSARATSRGIPGELPVMAALARSNLANRSLDSSGRAGY